MEIKWSKSALRQLDAAFDFITEQGFQSYANELSDNIFLRIDSLTSNYNIYPLDRFKKDNDGTYYAFEVNDYRISYRVKNQEIRILRIRHTSRKVFPY